MALSRGEIERFDPMRCVVSDEMIERVGTPPKAAHRQSSLGTLAAVRLFKFGGRQVSRSPHMIIKLRVISRPEY